MSLLWHFVPKYLQAIQKGTEAILRNLTENQEFLNIDKILKINVEATKCRTPRPLIQQFNI